MNPIYKSIIIPLMKRLINYAFSKLEDYAIDKFVEILDKDGDKKLSKQELKEYKTTIAYVKKVRPLLAKIKK